MNEMYNKFIDFCWSLVLSLFEMLKDIVLWAFDMFMGLGITILNSFTVVMQSFDFSQYIDALPVETKQVMALTGVDIAMGWIISALLIRIILQLIPFTRLGS